MKTYDMTALEVELGLCDCTIRRVMKNIGISTKRRYTQDDLDQVRTAYNAKNQQKGAKKYADERYQIMGYEGYKNGAKLNDAPSGLRQSLYWCRGWFDAKHEIKQVG